METTTEFNDTKRTDMFIIDPRLVRFDPINNPRTDYGDMESFENHIRENGTQQLPPIKVRRSKDENGQEIFLLVHGYRRMTAITTLLAEGIDIARVNAITVNRSYTEEDELFDHLFQNSGKPMLPHEEANVFKKLTDRGYTQAEIAKKIGKTPAHISNMLKVASCTKKVQIALSEGHISTTTVLKILQKHGDNAEEVILGAVNNAKALGKKATDKTVDEVTTGTASVRVSKYQKAITNAIALVVEANNAEQLAMLRKAEQIVVIMDTYKDAELIEKLAEVI